MTAVCVPVPVALLQRVARLIRCDADGAWCWEHEAESWPCPMARLLQYVPANPQPSREKVADV